MSGPITYISLFSGIEAASVAWEPLGWKPLCFCEIDEFPSAVLAEHYPDVPNLGDITKVDWKKVTDKYGRPDVVVGGSPCFPAGTLVITKDGTLPIEDVSAGDMVLTHTGTYERVIRTGSCKSNTIKVILDDQIIECTPNHPLLTIDGPGPEFGTVYTKWLRADQCKGLPLYRFVTTDEHERWLCDHPYVLGIEHGRDGVTVYNLEVYGNHSYTADGIVCHNCQSFSIAGGRESLHGESRLMFEYIRAVADIEPTFFIWENVPGSLSTKDNAFGQLLGEMERIGYCDLSWSILDSQFFGVAQRRKRVFLVGCCGGGYRSAAVLFDAESMRGNYQKEQEKRKELAAVLGEGSTEGGGVGDVTAFKYIAGAAARTMPIYTDGSVNTLTADWHAPAIAMRTQGSSSDDDIGCITPWDNQGWRISSVDGVSPTLSAKDSGSAMTGAPCVLTPIDDTSGCLTPWDVQSKRVFSTDSACPALPSGTSEGMHIQPIVAQPVAFAQNQRDEVRLVGGDGSVAGAVCSVSGVKSQTVIAQPTVMASGHSHAEIGAGGVSPTLTAHNSKDAPILFMADDHAIWEES